MTTMIAITLHCASDAEPGTGFGTGSLNDIVPRDRQGDPCIPASHLKGLAREGFGRIAALRSWPAWIEETLFGRPGQSSTDSGPEGTNQGEPGIARFRTLALDRGTPRSGEGSGESIRAVSRTAIGGNGTVTSGSLRTVERIAVGTRFQGSISVDAPTDSVEADALRLALITIGSIGGNRNRGSGRCRIEIAGVDATPSVLLKRIDARVNSAPIRRASTTTLAGRPLSGEVAIVLLEFTATDPVCCPTVPLTRTNVIRSGFCVPASAVQGAILHRINGIDSALASACYAAPSFRAWPLLPCSDPERTPQDGVIPVWTSLTHRMSKIASGVGDEHEFRDSMIDPYDWTQLAAASPLKAADGVLLAGPEGIELWRAADMPRHVSAHVALTGGEPELFTVEAMAPLTYRGLLALPLEALPALEASVAADSGTSFGRAKGVRGSGTLSVRPAGAIRSLLPQSAKPVCVVQSPIAIPEELRPDMRSTDAGSVLARLVEAEGWGPVERAQATIEIRFGWNTNGIGRRVGPTNRLAATPVVMPGSVFALRSWPIDMEERLRRGLGLGREQGFGAVLPHPGIASRRYAPAAKLRSVRSAENLVQAVDDLLEASRAAGLSPSQIARLVDIASAAKAGEEIRRFKDRQKQRPPAIWRRWEPVVERVERLMTEFDSIESRVRVLRAWQDATIASRAKEGRP